MPTSPSAFAAIAEIVGQIDPTDIRAVDEFFIGEFNALHQPIRMIAFQWAGALDGDPADADCEKLRELLLASGFEPNRSQGTEGATGLRAGFAP
jgi:hypothetical protein